MYDYASGRHWFIPCLLRYHNTEIIKIANIRRMT